MTQFIAEISNHHFGDFEKAKELIRVAKESGAHLVKGQAFKAKDMVEHGSMSRNFYEKCELKYNEYRDLLAYGKDIGIDVFYTVLNHRFNNLHTYQKWKKMPACISISCNDRLFYNYNRVNCFISFKEIRHKHLTDLQNANILYATGYDEDINLNLYLQFIEKYQKPIGISHHYHSVDNLVSLSMNHELPYVEKHFYLGDEIRDEKGRIYRDCYHSFTPDKFEKMVRDINE